MNDKVDNLTPNQIWQAALGDLQLQLTGATFDQWLLRTRCVSCNGDGFVIAVHNESAREWIEARLAGMIQRTLAARVGQPVQIRFITDTPKASSVEPEPVNPALQIEPRGFILPDYDPKEAGWFDVSEYASTFWSPLLGRIAWRVWEIVRETDHRPKERKTEWTPAKRWTAPRLAELVPCGRQALTGRMRNDNREIGAFGRLEEMEVAQVQRQGIDPHIIYTLSARTRLALLMPAQVQQLSENMRVKHDHWLEEHGFDPKAWFLSST
jgi:hypothetical protein